MMKIGLIDFDSKIPNLALMKLSTYYKNQGCEVFLNEFNEVDKVYCSVLFTWNKPKAEKLMSKHKNIEFGGTGWDINVKLPDFIENQKPDYNLYSKDFLYSRIGGIMKNDTRLAKAETLANMGIGFTSRGCVRSCGFCFVPKKEGAFRQTSEIKDIINPKSNIIALLDNNFTADPDMIEKCNEIKQRNLIVDFNQGLDIRLMTEEKAKALSEIKHLRSIHYAWDLVDCSGDLKIINGINTLKKFIKPWKHMCFMLVGYNTSFEQDMYRYQMLRNMNIDPYVMIYNKSGNSQLKHFARWVNARIYKVCSDFENYEPWAKERCVSL